MAGRSAVPGRVRARGCGMSGGVPLTIIKNEIMKETDKQKELYTSPECEVLEIKPEGYILQASYNGFGTEKEW